MQAVPPLQQGHHPDARGPAVLPGGWRRRWSSCSWARRRSAGTAAWRAGSLSISASEAALHMILLDKLSIFPGAVPGGVHLRITNETTPQAIERLRDGESDFAVITARCPPAAPCSRPSCCALPRYRVCGPAYSDMAARRCTMAELANCPLVCLGEGHQYIRFLPELFQQPRPALPGGCGGRHHGPDPAHGGARGWASGFYPSQLAAPRIARGELFCIPLDQPAPSGPSPWWRTPPVPAPPP